MECLVPSPSSAARPTVTKARETDKGGLQSTMQPQARTDAICPGLRTGSRSRRGSDGPARSRPLQSSAPGGRYHTREPLRRHENGSVLSL
ncbi:hypothetical protein NN561_009676 [Cricetulus griseus]